jgi:hypothetical protein
MLSLRHGPKRRPPKRGPMTLIAAFKCSRGFILHADSEENCGSFRRSVQKLIPETMGNLDVIVAGSGIGKLIEGFTAKLKQRLDADSVSDLAVFRNIVEKRLAHFYSNDVATYPTEDENKVHKFIIAARCKTTGEFEVWGTRHTTLVPVTSYELAGVEDDLYDHIAKRLYHDRITFSQAMIAGVHLFSVAESTSTFIRSPIQVAAVWKNGIQLEAAENVTAVRDRLEAYELEKRMNEIFLACADTSMSVERFDAMLFHFCRDLSSLHLQHIDRQADRTTISYLARTIPIRLLPEAIGYGQTGKLSVIHDPRKIAKQDAFIRGMIAASAQDVEKVKKVVLEASSPQSGSTMQSASRKSESEQ